MTRVKNTMKLVRKSIGHINSHYDMCADNIDDIMAASRDFYDLICNGFRFGYMQGMKAARAEMKKDGALNG